MRDLLLDVDALLFLFICVFLQKNTSYAIRTINSIAIEPSHAHSIQQCDNHQNDVEYISITFNARSYVHRQIRRVVNAIIGHALGRLTKRDIYELLTIPSKEFKMGSAPSHGLYLANIEFYQKAMQLKADDDAGDYDRTKLENEADKLENEGESETDDAHRKEKLAN